MTDHMNTTTTDSDTHTESPDCRIAIEELTDAGDLEDLYTEGQR
jgi:hypothetical protein